MRRLRRRGPSSPCSAHGTHSLHIRGPERRTERPFWPKANRTGSPALAHSASTLATLQSVDDFHTDLPKHLPLGDDESDEQHRLRLRGPPRDPQHVQGDLGVEVPPTVPVGFQARLSSRVLAAVDFLYDSKIMSRKISISTAGLIETNKSPGVG